MPGSCQTKTPRPAGAQWGGVFLGSGLGRLLAACGAGWEAGSGALLRAEAVLILQGTETSQGDRDR